MAVSIGSRLKNAWNVFRNKEQTHDYGGSSLGFSYGTRPDRIRYTMGTERSIISSIYTRIGIDASAYKISHVELDDDGNYKGAINSQLQYCLSTEANIDQTGRAFIQDIVMSLCDEGSVAVVPVDFNVNPNKEDEFEILTIRTGKILEWYPNHIRVKLYNDRVGRQEDIIVEKRKTAIIENPLYSVMNEPNSTLRRLIRKLNLLDILDSQNSSGKLDLIIQLPYVIKNKTRRNQAEDRRKDIEDQLINSKYGIAYTDGTEKITQLNRPVENTLLQQIESLTSMLYSQLGLSTNILNGTADEAELLNYYNRTTEPILSAIVDEFSRKFLSEEQRKNGESLKIFTSPFKFVSAHNMAEIADKYTRNEILTSNEVRSIIGFTPSKDPAADELRNKNLNRSKEDDASLKAPGEEPDINDLLSQLDEEDLKKIKEE